MRKEIAIYIISMLFIVLFTYAASSKLMSLENFRAQVGQSPLLTFMVEWVVWLVPLVELIVCLLLTIPGTRLAGLYGSFVLMCLFTGYIISILNFSSYVPCSCGGILEKMGWTEHLIFNFVFVFLALAGIVLSIQGEELPQR